MKVIKLISFLMTLFIHGIAGGSVFLSVGVGIIGELPSFLE